MKRPTKARVQRFAELLRVVAIDLRKENKYRERELLLALYGALMWASGSGGEAAENFETMALELAHTYSGWILNRKDRKPIDLLKALATGKDK